MNPVNPNGLKEEKAFKFSAKACSFVPTTQTVASPQIPAAVVIFLYFI